jgi:hypothetical protein
MNDLRLRDAMRAVVLDSDGKVLLVKFVLPHWVG